MGTYAITAWNPWVPAGQGIPLYGDSEYSITPFMVQSRNKRLADPSSHVHHRKRKGPRYTEGTVYHAKAVTASGSPVLYDFIAGGLLYKSESFYQMAESQGFLSGCKVGQTYTGLIQQQYVAWPRYVYRPSFITVTVQTKTDIRAIRLAIGDVYTESTIRWKVLWVEDPRGVTNVPASYNDKIMEQMIVSDFPSEEVQDMADAAIALRSSIEFLANVTADIMNQNDETIVGKYLEPLDVTEIKPRFSDLENSFLLFEHGLPFTSKQSLPEITWDRNWLIEHAYKDALDGVQNVWDNGQQNILSLIACLRSLKQGKGFKPPKYLNDAWLQYRYVLGTSVLDAQEAAESFCHSELQKLVRSSKWFHVYGRARKEVAGTMVTCTVKVNCRLALSTWLDEVIIRGDQWGLIPDFYMIWDFIPYSFIVDWFAPVGDMLDVVDTADKWADSIYDVRDMSVSFKYTHEHQGTFITNYSRWQQDPPDLHSLYWMDRHSPSAKTIVKRGIDTAALVLTKRKLF